MDRDQVPDSLRTLVYRQLRKRRGNERQLAEQRATKHQFEARKSCVADARNYRIAREFPISVVGQLDWEVMIPGHRSNISAGNWLKEFLNDHIKHWLPAK